MTLHDEIKYLGTGASEDDFVFKKKAVKQAIKEIIEWLNSKHCHCETCTKDKIRKAVGDGLMPDEAGDKLTDKEIEDEM